MTAGPVADAAAVGAGPAPLPTVTALVHVNTVWPDDPGELRLGGRRIAWRSRWGPAPVLADGVTVWSGGFRRGRVIRIGATPDCVLLVKDTPAGYLGRRGVKVWPGGTARTWYDWVGPERVEALLTEFFVQVAADRRVCRLVVMLDARVAVHNHLRYLLLVLLDGPQPYDRRQYLWQQWRRQYVALGMTFDDFDRLVWHLSRALRVVGVEREVSRHLLNLVVAGRWVVDTV